MNRFFLNVLLAFALLPLLLLLLLLLLLVLLLLLLVAEQEAIDISTDISCREKETASS